MEYAVGLIKKDLGGISGNYVFGGKFRDINHCPFAETTEVKSSYFSIFGCDDSALA